VAVQGSTSPVVRPSEADQYAAVFRALSEPLRMQMIGCFRNDTCACTLLEESLPISKSTISYHVKILKEAGLIEVRKAGRFYHYDLRRDVFEFYVPGFLARVGADA
jgi:ArsR family transcriptional regulator